MVNPLSKFGLTDAEIEAEIARHPGAVKGLQDLAAQMETYWKGLAPVFDSERDRREAPPNEEPGAYRDSIHTELTRSKKGLPTARVGTDDYKAVWIEFGSAHMPEYAPATKTAKYFGDTKGPVVSVGGASEAINQAQKRYSREKETLAKLIAEGAPRHEIAQQRIAVNRASGERSAAFKANRRRRGR